MARSGSKMIRFAVLGVVLMALMSFVAAEEPISCSGFVRASSALSKTVKSKLDLSSIRVKLVSSAGFVTFEGAPDPNGYYIVPVDAHVGAQKLVVQAPEGWTFEPSSVALNLANGECNRNEEINFELTGFRVAGLVQSSAKCASGALPHVNEEVALLGAADAVVATTSTQSDGSFKFENVAPGAYTLRTVGSSVPLQVINGNLEVRPEIVASGYALSGAVEGKEVSVVLYALSGDAAAVCGSSDLKQFARNPKWGNPACVTQSDVNGKYKFEFLIPCGQYVVSPFPQDGLHFSPESLTVKVDGSAQTTSDTPFKLVGVSVKGKVVNARSKPLADVQVTLKSSSATFTATTNEQGIYEIENVPIAKYKVNAEKKGYGFSLPSFEASASSRVVPDIVVVKVDICGKISIPHPPAGVAGGANRKINLKGAGPSDLQTTTDQNGQFCFQVPAEADARNVVLAPVVPSYERQAGLLLSSLEMSLSLDTSPIVNLHFAQALLSIRGQVFCLSRPCDQRISIQLTPLAGGETITTGLLPTSVQDGQSTFEFPMLVPGKYSVKMEKSEWCWQQEAFEVNLSDSSLETVEFIQTGFQLRVVSNQDIKIQYQIGSGSGSGSGNEKQQKTTSSSSSSSSNEKISLDIKKGKTNSFCIPERGTYTITPVSDVFQFEHEQYIFSTDEPHASTAALKVNAKRVKVSGEISVPDALHKTIVQASILRNGEQVDQFIEVQEVSKGDKTKTLEYFVWAEQGDEISIRPASKIMLYYPQTVSLKVSSISSASTAAVFQKIEARPGLFISGIVSPSVPDVSITIFDETDGDKVVLEGVKTDEKGAYSAGPLFDTHTYRVEAKAPGFHLSQQQALTEEEGSSSSKSKGGLKINFKASKLGALRVKVIDASTLSQPIVGALLSMSGGGGGYRSNNATNEDGEVLFANIFPGEYYLMPLLKEYTFAKDKQPVGEIPRHQHPIAISVKEGSESLLLVGSRIAFSCYGKVTSLNGQPEKGVYVEAKSGELMEKAQTDQNGQYRLRGLVPGQSYEMHVTTQGSNIERTSPSAYTLQVTQEDVMGKDFLAFRKSSSRFEVFGHVVTNATLLPYITVQLWEEQEGTSDKPAAAPSTSPVREVKLFANADFFSFAGLSRTKYSLRLKLDSSLNKALYSINLDEATRKISFSPDEPSVLTTLTLNSNTSNEVVEIPAGQVYATILAIIAFMGFYFRKPITKFIKAHRHKVPGSSTSTSEKTPKKSRKAPVEDAFVANLNKFGKN
jgi:hypothetical protein